MRVSHIALVAAVALGAVTWKAFADDVKPGDIPAAVKATLDREAPGATIKRIDVEEEHGKRAFEFLIVRNGKTEEITIGADGTLLGREGAEEDEKGEAAKGDEEAAVPEGAVPAVVRNAAARILSPAAPTGYTKETKDGVDIYEVEYAVEGGKGSLSFTGDGEFLEREEHAASVPAAVLKRIAAMHPGATVEGAEVVRIRYFELKVKVGDRTHEVKIDAAGRVFGGKHAGGEEDEEDEKDEGAEHKGR